MVTFVLHYHRNNLAFFVIHNELFNFVSNFKYIAGPVKTTCNFKIIKKCGQRNHICILLCYLCPIKI